MSSSSWGDAANRLTDALNQNGIDRDISDVGQNMIRLRTSITTVDNVERQNLMSALWPA